MSEILPKRLRQADIAAACGVSVSTVSRVLANEPGISDSIREAIMKAAHAMGYSSRSGQEARAGAMAIIASDSATGGLSIFYEGIADGLRAGAVEQGLRFDMRLIRQASMRVEDIGNHLAEANAEGLLLVGIDPSDKLREWITSTGTPVVLVNGIDPVMQFDSVSPSNFFGARFATQRLIDAGHRKILHLTGSHRHTIMERLRGFETAIADTHGCEGRVVKLPFKSTATEEAHAAMSGILAQDRDFTAAFCMNDTIAVGVLDAVREAGLRVPDDFAIVSFDDLPCAQMTNPRLSTMRVDRAALGRDAMALMASRLRDPLLAARQILHAVRLVPGGTLPASP